MSRDNFKDEFEQSKQPVERHDDLNDTPIDEPLEETNVEEAQDFPPRGISRRARSEKRRREVHHDEEQSGETETIYSSEESENKRRKRSIIASATGVGGSVVGNVSSGRKRTIEEPVEAETVHADPHDEEEKVVYAEEKKKNNKLIPLLAALLILIPICILIGLMINHYNGNNENETAVTANKEKSTEEPAVVKEKSDKEKKADNAKATADNKSSDKTKDKETTEKATTESATTESATSEDADVTTEVPSTEKAVPGGGASHVVGSNENLYRIAIKYYGSGSAENVEKIRRANGISGNEISTGQTLVIPE